MGDYLMTYKPILSGLDADKPVSPIPGDEYIALDTKRKYVCYQQGTWVVPSVLSEIFPIIHSGSIYVDIESWGAFQTIGTSIHAFREDEASTSLYSNQPIDLTDYSQMVIVWECTTEESGDYPQIKCGFAKQPGGEFEADVTKTHGSAFSPTQEVIDLSLITGIYYFKLYLMSQQASYNDYAHLYVYNVHLIR